MKYLLDTNPIIVAINNKYKLSPEDYFISFITEIELLSYSKLSDGEEDSIKSLISRLSIIDLNKDIKITTIKMRKKYNLKLPDSIIIATAIVENATLVTADKQLRKIQEIKSIGIEELVI